MKQHSLTEVTVDDLVRGSIPAWSIIEGAVLEGLNFRGRRIESLRIRSCKIVGCCFDKAALPDLRVWDTAFEECSFVETSLRAFAFGGQVNGRFNSFRSCNFTEADFRGAGGGPATMVECDFDRTKLTKVEFSGTRLVKSRFSGELREVIFQARAFSFPNEPPNTMDGVDFSKASLRWCDFRQLDLDRVVPPPEGEHVIVRAFPKFLDIAIARYRSTVPCRKAVAILEHMKKWLGPRQQIGFFHADDLAEFLPAGEVDDFRILAASISL